MLKPRKRLTKKQLKEDKLVTFYVKATAFVEENSKYLFGGAIAFVLLIAMVFAYSNSLKSAQQKASVELARATRAYDAGDYQNALLMLSNLVEEYGRTQSGKIGLLYLANSYYFTGDYQSALENYKKFVSKFKGDDYLIASGMRGIAACYEQMEKWQEAAEQYEKTAKKFPKSILAPELLIKAARCYTNAGDKEKAKELYQKVIDDYPKAQEKQEALLLLAML